LSASEVTRSRNKAVSAKDRERFLDGLRRGLTVSAAAEAAAHPAVTYYALASRDAEFAEAKALAMQIGADVLENEAYRRSVEGWQEPVVGKVAPGIDGHVVGPDGEPMYVTKYSDRLTEVLLKGRRPEYRDSPRVDVRNQTLNVMSREDRSASMAEVAEVLRAAGVDLADVGVPLTEDVPPVVEAKKYAIEKVRL
jgi:hypothetical protein